MQWQAEVRRLSVARYYPCVRALGGVARGLIGRGLNPSEKFRLNPCEPLSMRVLGIFRQGFKKVADVCTSASPYPCGFQGCTNFLCSKEHCRGVNPCMHLRIRAPGSAVNPNLRLTSPDANYSH